MALMCAYRQSSVIMNNKVRFLCVTKGIVDVDLVAVNTCPCYALAESVIA